MIEVALAMAVIAFGMTSILGLFPVGLNACRNAIAENSASDAAGQFSSYLKGYAESSKKNFENLFGTSAGTGYYTQVNPMTAPAMVGAAKVASMEFLNAITTGKDLSGGNYVPLPVAKGWSVFSYAGPVTTPALSPDIYFTVFGPGNYFSTATATFPTTDFSALVVVWKSPLTYYVPTAAGAWDPTPVQDSTYSLGAGLNVEVSWPLDVADYSARQKRTFYIEINKPQ